MHFYPDESPGTRLLPESHGRKHAFSIAANQVLQSWCNGGYNIGIHQLSAPAGGCFTKKPWTTRAISHSSPPGSVLRNSALLVPAYLLKPSSTKGSIEVANPPSR